MNTLDGAYVLEQNKIASSGAWIWLLEIATTGLSTLRYTNDNDSSDVVWPTGGNTYSRMPLGMDDVEFSTSGKFPELRVQLGDVALPADSTLRTRISATAGLVGSTIRLMVVHSDHLDLTTPAIDELVEILNCELTSSAVIFTMGIPSLLSRRLPRDRYAPGFCRHKFAGGLCQYVQPVRTVTSYAVEFFLGDGINTIFFGDVDIVQNLFQYALPLGAAQGANWALSKDTGFTISGSVFNDGFFLADNFYVVSPTLVYVMTEDDGARPFVEEAVTTGVVIQLGYNTCDHTLEACKLRDNTQNFGGSPGIAGGVYG